ncbi:ubiquitin-specific protease doa4 [Coemansia sp. RSA 2598]|nr:ubiquitin-specific protease doa4 [Coemansia sp. RSA 2598]
MSTENIESEPTPSVPGRLSSFPVLENTPPLAPVASSPALARSPLAVPSARESFGAAPSSLPPTKPRSNSQIEELASIITSSYAKTTSAGTAPGNAKSQTAPRKKSLVTALNQRATIDPTINVSSRTWLRTADRYMDEARLANSAGNSEGAYLKYMLASNILYGQLPKLRDYATVKADATYKRLDKEFHDRVIRELEILADELRLLPYVEPAGKVPESQQEAAEQLDQMESAFIQKYPDLQLSHSMTSVESLTSPQHRPSRYPEPAGTGSSHVGGTPSSANSVSSAQWLAAERSKVDEIDAQARLIDAQAARMIDVAKSTASSLPGVSVISHGNPRVAVALSPRLASIGETHSSNEYVGSATTTCTPSELWDYMERSRAAADGRPTVLILDVRPHQDYVWGHIDHHYTVNVDPLGIKKGCSSADIESSLVLAPDEQQDWFKRRSEFDIVVYVGQSIRSFGDTASKELAYMEHLNSAIYHYEYERPLKHAPLFLLGGFEAWSQEMGNQHCIWSDEARRSMARSARPKSMSQWTLPVSHGVLVNGGNVEAVSAADISSMLSYHAPTSGISTNPLAPYHVRYDAAPPIPPIPPVPAIPSVPVAPAVSDALPEPTSAMDAVSATTATPPVSGSVFDFFQQNNIRYPQGLSNRSQLQYPQTQGSSEDRHRPTHASFTHGYNGVASPTKPSNALAADTPVSTEPTKASVSERARFSGNFAATADVGSENDQGNSASGVKEAPVSAAENLSELNRRKTIFDNPTYGFTGPAYGAQHGQEAFSAVSGEEQLGPKMVLRKRRQPPPIPAMKLPPKPSEYSRQEVQGDEGDQGGQGDQGKEQAQQQMQQQHIPAPPPSAPLPPKPQAYAVAQPGAVQAQPQFYQYVQQPMHYAQQYPQQFAQGTQHQHAHHLRMQQQQQQMQYQAQLQMQQQAQAQAQAGYAHGRNFYGHPVAAGSDPSLNGRMHAGGNLRSSVAYSPAGEPGSSRFSPAVSGTSYPGTSQEKKPRKQSTAALDSAAYGATGLKNFGNTCFMNCVIQCLVGTGPFCRYFLQGSWKKDLVRDGSKKSDAEVAVEFARLVDNMWRGQYGSLSPIGFRSAVGSCSAQFKGNDQEDAQEFALFLLDTLHESLNRVHPRPAPDRDLTPEEEQQFEQLPDLQQANIQWERYIRRNWSIMTSIFQGQIQSRLTCLSCNNTSTTYYTFTELSVPIPSTGAKAGGATALLRKSVGRSGAAPVSIYQCLNAFAEVETLDGENKWKCPRCKAKRRATKRLLVSRLPLVLIVHLKRFSTIGHFREKLETNVVFPTQQLQMDPYVISDMRHQAPTGYNLYAVANHYGTLSAGHYTASVFNGLRRQWNYFDDTRVSPIAEDKVATPAAYLLFFVQNHAQG